jgi:hypothetical protein
MDVDERKLLCPTCFDALFRESIETATSYMHICHTFLEYGTSVIVKNPSKENLEGIRGLEHLGYVVTLDFNERDLLVRPCIEDGYFCTRNCEIGDEEPE